MLQTLGSYKAGLLVLVGIVVAPVLEPVLAHGVTTTVRAGRKAKELSGRAVAQLKLVAAEAVIEMAMDNGG